MPRVARVFVCAVLLTAGVLGVDTAAQRRGGAAAPAVRRETPKFECPAVTGIGVSTKRRYCDIRIANVVEDGIRIEIPARTGAAVLQFDLHNRFSVSGMAVARQRHDAMVALVGPTGAIVGRGAVRGELRTAKDLFDRLAPLSGRGTIAAAPGLPQRIRISVPSGAAFVSLVGMRLDVQLPSKLDRIETVGRPIAVASNFEISYTSAPVRR
ncbi:MAG: hypothetical protein M3Q55_06415 [Acidobacteriota bacterium]|nr:hypothetical protein [Acidobacteriota bacterium]